MPLISMKEILYAAHSVGYGVGAYNVLNTDALQGIIKAAEEKRSPLILQMAQVRDSIAPLALIGPALVAAARKATVPVAVHLDHGETFEYAQQAIELGFTSVMVDASAYPLAQNIEYSKKVADYARSKGVSVEAEIGCLNDEGGGSNPNFFTVPEEAKAFCEAVEPDVLAVSIGNVHGPYKGEPNIQYELLETIHAQVGRPIVLHGGSGIDQEGFRKCIARGVSKINIATANYGLATQRMQAMPAFEVYQENSFVKVQQHVIQAVYEKTMEHMDMFMSSGKA